MAMGFFISKIVSNFKQGGTPMPKVHLTQQFADNP